MAVNCQQFVFITLIFVYPFAGESCSKQFTTLFISIWPLPCL